MPVLLTLLLIVLLLGALVVLLRAYQALMHTYVWAILLLTAGWVIANILIVSWLGELGQNSGILHIIYLAWYNFFYYTAPFQGLVFTVLVFWGLAILFQKAPPPSDRMKFVLDFVIGSSYLAGLILIFGLGVFALVIGELKGLLLFLDYAYIIVGTAILCIPWIFKKWLIAFMQRHSPQLVFWIAIGVYVALSASGMYLAMGPLLE